MTNILRRSACTNGLMMRVPPGIGEGATFPLATKAMSTWLPGGKSGWAQTLKNYFLVFFGGVFCSVPILLTGGATVAALCLAMRPGNRFTSATAHAHA